MAATAKPISTEKTEEPKDNFREVIETVVFVVVLVLMLKLFVAEAYVIPTGSMADTELGIHKDVVCRECGYKFRVNAAEEVEPQNGVSIPVVGYECPNCRCRVTGDDAKRPGEMSSANTGDRVLVQKIFDEVKRFDTVVFKHLELEIPRERQQVQNYIKRLIGLPGETILILQGKLYRTAKLHFDPNFVDPNDRSFKPFARPAKEEELCRLQFTFAYNNPAAYDLMQAAFQRGDFEIIKKPPQQLLEMKRPVFDNDFQPASLVGKVRPRWFPEKAADVAWQKGTQPDGWMLDDPRRPRSFTRTANGLGWLEYQHLVPIWSEINRTAPVLITNFMGYNSANPRTAQVIEPDFLQSWVSDLHVECIAEFAGGEGSEIVLDLAKAKDRFQARFLPQSGTVELYRPTVQAGPIATQSGIVFKTGSENVLRFANVDQRLTVWVNGKVIDFGPQADYAIPTEAGMLPHEIKPTDNDLRPARIGVSNGVTVRRLRIDRDTYYTQPQRHIGDVKGKFVGFYVHPGHYLCLGDNSAASHDGRSWGTVPHRAMLGRALIVYWPIWRMGFIR